MNRAHPCLASGYRLMLAILLLASLLAACTSDERPPDLTRADGVVTIGFGVPPADRALYQPLIATFNEQNTDMRVQMVGISTDGDSNEVVGRATRAADTAAVDSVSRADMTSGRLFDLAPLADADATFARDDWYPGTLDMLTLDNRLFMLPRSAPLPLLAYNKQLWVSRGLPPPQPDWTWEDLAAAATQLARKQGDKIDVYGLYDGGDGRYALLGELASAGILPFATPAGQFRLDQPKVGQAIERVRALVESGAVALTSPSARGTVATDNPYQLIFEQHVALWWPQYFSPNSSNAPAPPFDVGIVPMPALPLPYSDVMFAPGGYIMSSGTRYPQQAWRWLSFLSHQTLGVQYAVLAAAPVPPRRSLAESSGYWKNFDAETRQVIEASLRRRSLLIPIGQQQPEVFEALSLALHAVIDNHEPVDQALQSAQARLSEQLAQMSAPVATNIPPPVVSPVPEHAPPGVNALTFSAWGFDQEGLRRLGQAFNQANPDTFVQISEPTDNNSATQLDELPDTIDCFATPLLAGQSPDFGTLDLQPLIDADATFNLKDYPSGFLAPLRRGASLYGLPYTVALRALAYNRDAFDAAGIAYPTAGWTLDDMLRTAQQLTDTRGTVMRYGFADMTPQTTLAFILSFYDAKATINANGVLHANLTDPNVVRAARFYAELLRTALPRQSARSADLAYQAEVANLLDLGQVGMWFSTDLSEVQAQSAFTAALAPTPGGALVNAGPVAPIGLYISARTKHAEACWGWLKYLSQNATILAGGFPARSSLAQSSSFHDRAPAGALSVFDAYRTAASAASPDETALDPRFDSYWLLDAIDQSLQGKDLVRALAHAQELTERYMACIKQGISAQACVIQVDPEGRGKALG